jgi:hypothetical protein
VPQGYETHDSDDVKLVNDELEALVTSHPMDGGTQVVHDFVEFVTRYSGKLEKKYGVANVERWPVDPYTAKRAPPHSDPRFTYIFHEKLGEHLKGALVDLGLATLRRGNDPRWVGVHPDVAAVYMTSVAEAISDETGYRLLADELARHVVVGERSVRRLAQMLLKGHFDEPPDDLITPEIVAIVALRTVVPKDLASVPMSKIIEFRKHFKTELTDFQTWFHQTAGKITERTGGVYSPKALMQHLTVLEEDEIKPRLAAFKRQVQLMGMETLTGTIGAKLPIQVPATEALKLAASAPAKVATAAFAAATGISKLQRDAYKLATGAYTSYLMHAEEYLTPLSMVKRVTLSARKFALDI